MDIDLLGERIAKPKPILKWAGGKQAITQTILAEFPTEYNRYFEPFLGGASVVLSVDPRDGVVGDQNTWLIDTYEAIRDDWKAVAAKLDVMPNTKDHYLKIRSIPPSSLPKIEKAAQLIYLNKTCFRGLFRVNRKGGFNVPYGNYDRRYYSPANLETVSECFQNLTFCRGDFESTMDGITAGDFAYFDPPYYKLGGHSDFNRYTAVQFRESEQIRLASLCRELDQRGVQWVLSNSLTPFIKKLYQGFRFVAVDARREINLKSNRRAVKELLIKNF